MTANNDQQAEGSVFARVAQELLDSAERVTNTMEQGIQALFSGQSSESVEPSQDLIYEESFGDNAEFTQVDYETMIREQLEGSPLEGMAEHVIGGIMKGQVGPQTFMEHVSAFRHAIRWDEPLLLALMGFQLFMFLLTLWISRRGRSMEARLMVMVGIGAIVKGAQRINAYGAAHWEQIATQNYFDQGGIFLTILLCAPLLFDCFIMLVCFLREAASLLVQVKTAEIKQKRKQQAKDGAAKSNESKKKK